MCKVIEQMKIEGFNNGRIKGRAEGVAEVKERIIRNIMARNSNMTRKEAEEQADVLLR